MIPSLPPGRGTRPLIRRLALALVAVLAFGCATASLFTSDDTAAVDQLLGLIGERLDVAPEVARTKWNSHAAIDDPPREALVLDAAVAAATEVGLDPQVARAFIRGQIEANKAVQIALHAEWTATAQPPFANIADLATTIRPVLNRLTPAMVRALADALPVLQRRGGRQLLETRAQRVLDKAPGGEAVVGTAIAPLRRLAG